VLSAYYVVVFLFALFISFVWSSRLGFNLLIKISAFVIAIASAVLFLREQGLLIQI
jgi:hypothetical protein